MKLFRLLKLIWRNRRELEMLLVRHEEGLSVRREELKFRSKPRGLGIEDPARVADAIHRGNEEMRQPLPQPVIQQIAAAQRKVFVRQQTREGQGRARRKRELKDADKGES